VPGAQLLVFGHLVILFLDLKTLQMASCRILPVTIGSMSFSFGRLSIMPISNSTSAGNIIEPLRYSRAARISAQPNILDPAHPSCALGVKVYIPQRGVTAWTSPTQAWVPQKISWKKRVADVLRRLAFWKSGRPKAIGQTGTTGAGAVGKIMFYEGAHVVSMLHTYLQEFQIGTVAHAYDAPSVDRTYPGYQHDLALITGLKLPRF
jgi:hypothetical protein